MITVGFSRELLFMSRFLRHPVDCDFPQYNFHVNVTPDGFLSARVGNNDIWREKIDGDDSMFGVESCDTIARILFKIQNNDPSWIQMVRID